MRYLHNIGCKRIVILFWSLSSHCEHWEVGSSELLWEWHVFFLGWNRLCCHHWHGGTVSLNWTNAGWCCAVNTLNTGISEHKFDREEKLHSCLYVTFWCTSGLYWSHVEVDIYPMLVAMVPKSGKWNCGWCSLCIYELTQWLLSWITVDWILAIQVSVLNCGFGLSNFAHLIFSLVNFGTAIFG